MLPYVFDLFVQGERIADRRQAGMGLGLALVRRLVELHGGTVHAASAGPNRGSTFTVRLRAAAVDSPAAADAPVAGPWQDRHAVIIAPAEQTPLDTAGLLGAAGCRVTLVADVQAGMHFILAHRPDIVLVDLAHSAAVLSAGELRAAGAACAIVGLATDGAGAVPQGFDAVLQRPAPLQALLQYATRHPLRAFAA
jgi:CheY-like chemotaxis protein